VRILDKATSAKEIVEAVREAATRESGGAESPKRKADEYPLTLREAQVLEMLAAGRHNYEAAETLGVSSKTVEFHVTNLMAKLGARSRTDAVLIAQNMGLLDPSRLPTPTSRPTPADLSEPSAVDPGSPEPR